MIFPCRGPWSSSNRSINANVWIWHY